MEIQQGIKEFLIEIEVRKYTPRTIRGYRNNLNRSEGTRLNSSHKTESRMPSSA